MVGFVVDSSEALYWEKEEHMSEIQEQPQVDVEKIGCRIVDVHVCLQKAFEEFAQSGDNTLEGLAKEIQASLSEMPVFIIGDQS